MGLSKEIFLKAPIQDLLCPICLDVLDEPLQVHCPEDHIFCEQCIIFHLKTGRKDCPLCRAKLDQSTFQASKFVKRQIGRLHVKCMYFELGCDWTGPQSTSHEDFCVYAQTPCPNKANGCPEKPRRQSVETHRKTCPYEQIKCPNRMPDCKPFLRRQQEQHDARCPSFHCEYYSKGCPFQGTKPECTRHAENYCGKLFRRIQELEQEVQALRAQCEEQKPSPSSGKRQKSPSANERTEAAKKVRTTEDPFFSLLQQPVDLSTHELQSFFDMSATHELPMDHHDLGHFLPPPPHARAESTDEMDEVNIVHHPQSNKPQTDRTATQPSQPPTQHVPPSPITPKSTDKEGTQSPLGKATATLATPNPSTSSTSSTSNQSTTTTTSTTQPPKSIDHETHSDSKSNGDKTPFVGSERQPWGDGEDDEVVGLILTSPAASKTKSVPIDHQKNRRLVQSIHPSGTNSTPKSISTPSKDDTAVFAVPAPPYPTSNPSTPNTSDPVPKPRRPAPSRNPPSIFAPRPLPKRPRNTINTRTPLTPLNPDPPKKKGMFVLASSYLSGSQWDKSKA